MSIQNFVFLKDKDGLELQHLIEAISQQKLMLKLPADFNLSSEVLLKVEAEFKALPCVFDYAMADYHHKDWSWADEDVAWFEDCQAVAMFNCYSNAQEIMALMVSSCVLAHHTGGLLYAPVFHDGLITGDEALGLLNKHHDDIKAQFNGVSKLR